MWGWGQGCAELGSRQQACSLPGWSGTSLVCCRVKPHTGYRKHWPKGSWVSESEEEVALGWGFDLKLVEGRQSSRRGFLTIIPGSAVLIMFLSMCSGQETDKLTGPDSRIKPKSQEQWHILVTPVFERQKQEDCFKFKASLSYIGRWRPAWQSCCNPSIQEANTGGSQIWSQAGKYGKICFIKRYLNHNRHDFEDWGYQTAINTTGHQLKKCMCGRSAWRC